MQALLLFLLFVTVAGVTFFLGHRIGYLAGKKEDALNIFVSVNADDIPPKHDILKALEKQVENKRSRKS